MKMGKIVKIFEFLIKKGKIIIIFRAHGYFFYIIKFGENYCGSFMWKRMLLSS